MGYSTYFSGQFQLDRPADAGLVAAMEMVKEDAHKFGHPTPSEGDWCDWELQTDWRMPKELAVYNLIGHNGNEKFYGYIEWLQFIIKVILKPRGYILNGEVMWHGEDPDDHGFINVRDNVLDWDEAVFVPQKWYNTARAKVGDY